MLCQLSSFIVPSRYNFKIDFIKLRHTHTYKTLIFLRVRQTVNVFTNLKKKREHKKSAPPPPQSHDKLRHKPNIEIQLVANTFNKTRLLFCVWRVMINLNMVSQQTVYNQVGIYPDNKILVTCVKVPSPARHTHLVNLSLQIKALK